MIYLIKDKSLSSQYGLRISLILQNLNWIIWYDAILTDCFDNNKVSVHVLTHEYQLHGFKINVRPSLHKNISFFHDKCILFQALFLAFIQNKNTLTSYYCFIFFLTWIMTHDYNSYYPRIIYIFYLYFNKQYLVSPFKHILYNVHHNIAYHLYLIPEHCNLIRLHTIS